ncbi:hypothetical protein SVIOM342S_03982 [Streptomyces violaceorubidus]
MRAPGAAPPPPSAGPLGIRTDSRSPDWDTAATLPGVPVDPRCPCCRELPLHPSPCRSVRYALIALGFVTIFKASGVLSFTHGSLLLLGGYLVAVLHDDIGFAGALAVAVLVTAAVAGVLDRLVLQRVGGSDPHAAHVQTIVTIGIDIVLVTDLARRIGGDLLPLGDPWATP